MSQNPGEVLKRALAAVASVLVGLMAVAIFAGPARAGEAEGDPLPSAAAQTLSDLRGLRVARVASALSGGSVTDATAKAAYGNSLASLASIVAPRTTTAPEAFVQAWSAADPTRMTVLLSALSEVGVPYRSLGSSPGDGFDCSGLTMYAWSQGGVALPHRDSTQINQSASRTWDTAQTADLVQYPGHVMMYLGAGQAIVHAPNSGSVVRVQDIYRTVRLASPLG